MIDVDNIPAELRALPQWVLWKAERNTKVPYTTRGTYASSTDPSTWTTFDAALAAESRYSGIGFVFSGTDGLVGIDLDDCIVENEIADWAHEIITTMQSYAEVSPSGNGVKLWVRGELDHSVKTKHVEIYPNKRFFTMTGWQIEGTPSTIRAVNGELDDLVRRVRPVEEPTPAPVDELPRRNQAGRRYLERWAERKIEYAVARVKQALDGEKHNERFAMARLLGGLIPHGLATEDSIERALYNANPPRTEAQRAERKTIRDGIRTGASAPLELPEEPEQPVFDSGGTACCPLHQRALAPAKNGNGYTCRARDSSTDSGWCAYWWDGEGYVAPRKTNEQPRIIDTTTGEIIETPARAPLVRTDWRTTGITLAALQHKEFVAERWIIEDLLPEGACLLAAKYKSKKSWMSLAVALAVAMNGRALGRYRVDPGRVLYLDLEGKQQRIQKRARAILGVQQVAWPENFHVFTKWPRGEEGYRELEYWYQNYPDTALSIVDVLASLRRPMDKNEMIYEYDRDTVDPLNQLFERYKSAGLLVHHFNKGKHDDIMDSITGSTGLPSAVNSMWALARDPNNAEMQILSLRGRDYENEDPIALRWDSYLTMHVVEGKAADISISAERKRLLACFTDDQTMSLKELGAALEMSVPNVHKLLSKMITDGLIDKVGYGRYGKIARSG